MLGCTGRVERCFEGVVVRDGLEMAGAPPPSPTGGGGTFVVAGVVRGRECALVDGAGLVGGAGVVELGGGAGEVGSDGVVLARLSRFARFRGTATCTPMPSRLMLTASVLPELVAVGVWDGDVAAPEADDGMSVASAATTASTPTTAKLNARPIAARVARAICMFPPLLEPRRAPAEAAERSHARPGAAHNKVSFL